MAVGITYVEMDVPRCTLTYGVAPCSAELGVTGPEYCRNSPGSCQVPVDFTPETHTLRWVTNSETAPVELLPAVPNVLEVRTRPQVIDPGRSLGRRERVTISFKNHRHNDLDIDPYPETRTYNPYERGTYWGKISANWPNMVGYPLRAYRGTLADVTTDPREGLEVLHYEVENHKFSLSGFAIDALDGLVWLEDKKTLFPKPSNGILSGVLSDAGTEVTLTPAGIGAQYPSSGEAAIGKEVVSYTRSGDVFTLTGRGLYGTDQKQHDSGLTFQVIGVLEGNVAEVFEQLLLATGTPAEYYDVAAWILEAEQFAPEIMLGKFLPTPVNQLVNFLIREMALTIFVDVVRRKFVLRVMRPEIPVGRYTYDNGATWAGNYNNEDRVDSVYYRFGRFSPIDKFDEDKNYNGRLYYVDDDPQQAINNNPSAIEDIYAVFVRPELRQTASVVSEILTGRYNRVLREASFVTTREFAPQIGQVVEVEVMDFEDVSGGTALVPMQVVSADVGEHQVSLSLLEYVVVTDRNAEEGVRIVSLQAGVPYYGVNLRQLHDSGRGTTPIPAGTHVIFQASPGTIFGGRVSGGSVLPALTLNAADWPEVFNDGVTLEIQGLRIFGKGGDAATGVPNVNGGPGGPAMYTRVPIQLTDSEVGGGGGAGKSSHMVNGNQTFFRGGGGAGWPVGLGRPNGSQTEGGNDPFLSNNSGGDLGEAGEGTAVVTPDFVQGNGGPAGYAINGLSYVTIAGTTTVLGSTSN